MIRNSSESSAMALLGALRKSGFSVEPDGDRIRIAPRTALTSEVRRTLAARKGEVLNALSTEARILQMPLDRFEREGRFIEIRVPWLPETLWFVPGEEQAEVLTGREISRGRVWTARELMFLWSLPSLDKKTVEKLGSIKAQLDGEILSVEGPGEGAAEYA